MSHIAQRVDEFGGYTEVIEDLALAEALTKGANVKFTVLEDEWTEDYSTRIIKRVELISCDTP